MFPRRAGVFFFLEYSGEERKNPNRYVNQVHDFAMMMMMIVVNVSFNRRRVIKIDLPKRGDKVFFFFIAILSKNFAHNRSEKNEVGDFIIKI